MANRKGTLSGREYLRGVQGAQEYDLSPAQVASLIGAASATNLTALTATVAALSALHLSGASAPVDYTDGTPPATGEGISPKGGLYTDTTAGLVYRNSGTQAQPLWTLLADAA